MASVRLGRMGRSLVVTVPQCWTRRNHLAAGSRIEMEIDGRELRLQPAARRKAPADLLTATPDGLQRVAGWDDMPAAALERCLS